MKIFACDRTPPTLVALKFEIVNAVDREEAFFRERPCTRTWHSKSKFLGFNTAVWQNLAKFRLQASQLLPPKYLWLMAAQ